MKKIINWIKSSNHYYHIALLAALALVMMSIGAFEFRADRLWTNVWQSVKFGLMTGLVIEAYQAIVSRTFDLRNSLGDLIADAIGLVLGLGVYLFLAWCAPVSAIVLYILAWCAPVSAIVLYILAFFSVVWAFIYKELRYYLMMLFFGCAIVGFSLFIYA